MYTFECQLWRFPLAGAGCGWNLDEVMWALSLLGVAILRIAWVICSHYWIKVCGCYSVHFSCSFIFCLLDLGWERREKREELLLGSAWLKCPFDPPVVLCPLEAWLLYFHNKTCVALANIDEAYASPSLFHAWRDGLASPMLSHAKWLSCMLPSPRCSQGQSQDFDPREADLIIWKYPMYRSRKVGSALSCRIIN